MLTDLLVEQDLGAGSILERDGMFVCGEWGSSQGKLMQNTSHHKSFLTLAALFTLSTTSFQIFVTLFRVFFPVDTKSHSFILVRFQ